jgi:hypothetical protein
MTKQLLAFPTLLANGLSIYLKPIKNKPSISTSVLNLGGERVSHSKMVNLCNSGEP